MNTDLVYDEQAYTMVVPLSFQMEPVEYANDYYNKDTKWFLDTFQESELLGVILIPNNDYYSISLKEPIGPYVNATPCIFYKRNPKYIPRQNHLFTFDSEYKKDEKYFSENPYVVMMRGCDDGHLGFSVKNIEEAKNILYGINGLGLIDIQDLNNICNLQYHN